MASVGAGADGGAVGDNGAAAALLASWGRCPDGEGWSQLSPAEVESSTGDWHYWRDRVCDYDPTPLHEAAAGGRVHVVKALLSAGCRRNPRASKAKCLCQPGHQLNNAELTHEPGGVTPLHMAAQLGHAGVIHLLVQAGANANILGGKLAEPPLHLATRYGHTGAMLALIDNRADINAGNCFNQTALHRAKSVSTLGLLLLAGADANGVATRSGRQQRLTESPLGVLISATNIRLKSESEVEEATALVNVLLQHGADATIPGGQDIRDHQLVYSFPDSRSNSPATTPDTSSGRALSPVFFISAVKGDCSPDISDESEGFSSEKEPEDHQPLECDSPSSESTECFWWPKSTWLGLPSSPGSLLPMAAKNGALGIVSALLRTGLDPSEQDEHRTSPLHYAAEEGHSQIVLLLLQAGAKVDVASHEGKRTPLHAACLGAQLDCVLELLRWGADVNAVCVLSDNKRVTPLQLVSRTDLCAVSNTASRCSRECEGAEIDVQRGGYAGQQKAGVEATLGAIRQALQREDRWRRRGGVVVLLSLLNKSDPRNSGAPAPENIIPALPLLNHSGSAGIANLEKYFGNELDRDGATVRGNQDAQRVCPTTPGSDAEESVIGGGNGHRKWSVLICAMAEDDGAGNPTKTALAGLMHLGWRNESLFRWVAQYL